MVDKKKDDDNDKANLKRIKELAGRLATTGFGASMYERFDADDLAQYCLDVAEAIYTYTPTDEDDEDE